MVIKLKLKPTSGFLARPDTSLDFVFTTWADEIQRIKDADGFSQGETCQPTVCWKSVRPTVLFRGSLYSTPYWLLIQEPNWRLQT